MFHESPELKQIASVFRLGTHLRCSARRSFDTMAHRAAASNPPRRYAGEPDARMHTRSAALAPWIVFVCVRARRLLFSSTNIGEACSTTSPHTLMMAALNGGADGALPCYVQDCGENVRVHLDLWVLCNVLPRASV
jgi:hypothetical protein